MPPPRSWSIAFLCCQPGSAVSLSCILLDFPRAGQTSGFPLLPWLPTRFTPASPLLLSLVILPCLILKDWLLQISFSNQPLFPLYILLLDNVIYFHSTSMPWALKPTALSQTTDSFLKRPNGHHLDILLVFHSSFPNLMDSFWTTPPPIPLQISFSDYFLFSLFPPQSSQSPCPLNPGTCMTPKLFSIPLPDTSLFTKFLEFSPIILCLNCF